MNQGAIYQLAAKGTEDYYLYGNPDTTYFKQVFLKHSVFQREQIELKFYGDIQFGSKNTCTIGKIGDFLSQLWLEITVPSITAASTGANGNGYWIPFLGHAIIKTVEIEIAGTRIDKQYGRWMQIWYELTTPIQKRAVGDQFLGSFTSQAQRLYVPLQFWFCRYLNQAIPLAALQYSDIKINIEFAQLNELYITDGYSDNNLIIINNDQNQNLNMTAVLIAEFIHVGNEERHRIASSAHEYLIEQLQFNDLSESSIIDSSIYLKFTNPVKELFWVSQKKPQSQVIKNFNYFNFTDVALQKKQNNTLQFPLSILTDDDFKNPFYNNIFNYFDEFNNTQSKTILINGDNPTFKCSLIFDGVQRIQQSNGSYFNYLQQYEHHTGATRKGINVYSFSQFPEQFQPSGSCNFANLNNVRLNITYTPQILNRSDIPNFIFIQQLDDYTDFVEDLVLTYIYSTSYNVIRIISGICTLLYPN